MSDRRREGGFSEDAFKESLQQGELRGLADDPHLAQAYANLAHRAWAAGEVGAAHEYYAKCVALTGSGVVLERRETCSFKEYCSSRSLPYRVVKPAAPGTNYRPTVHGVDRRDLAVDALLPEIYVATLRDVEVVGAFDPVFTADGAVVWDMLRHPENRRYVIAGKNLLEWGDEVCLTVRPPGPAEELPSGIQIFGQSSFNFAHWLVEYLPRLRALDDDCDLDGVPLLVDQRSVKDPHYVELLRACNTRGRPVQLLEQDRLYRVGELHVPSRWLSLANNLLPGERITSRECVVDPELFGWLREHLFRPGDEPVDRLLYVQRGGAQARRLTNEDEVDVLMASLGFEVIEPVGMTLDQKQRTFARARLLVHLGGSGVMNMLFAPPGAVNITASTTDWLDATLVATMCRHTNQRQITICGEPRGNVSEYAYHADFRVDVDVLREAIAAELAATP